MVLVEIACIDAANRVLDTHADHLAAGIEIERRACRPRLLDAGMLAVVEEDNLARTADYALRLIESGVGNRQAVARRHVAVGAYLGLCLCRSLASDKRPRIEAAILFINTPATIANRTNNIAHDGYPMSI